MDTELRVNAATPPRYWYPLSVPTYGIDEVAEALDSMVRFRTSMWEKTRRFEEAFAELHGAPGSVMVNSGSSADLLLALALTNPIRPLLKAGDEVLLPVVTWPTQIWSVKMAGLIPRLVDVSPSTLNVDVASLAARLTSRTKAIFLVHLMGVPCDMDPILSFAREHGLVVLEDCCEALGASYGGRLVGTFGLGGAYSFFFSHHMVTMEGGAVVYNDAELGDHLRVLRAHGWTRNVASDRFTAGAGDIDVRYTFVNWGLNVRPTELQAGFGLAQLSRLPGYQDRRRLLAARFFSYIDSLQFMSRPVVPIKAEPAWFALPMMVSATAPYSKSDIVSHLERNGVETRPIVAGNLARHPVAKVFPEFQDGEFPGADEVHERGFYVGLSPTVTDGDMERLIELFKAFHRRFEGAKS